MRRRLMFLRKGRGCFCSFLIFTILSMSGCGTGEQGEHKRAVSNKKNEAVKIEFQSEMHNFGTLKDGETVSFSFVFKNIGHQSVKIENVLRSCDCITVSYPDAEIAPGKESDIEVTLKTFGEWGNLLKTVEVQTSAGEKKQLTVSAYVENDQFNNLLKKQR